MFPDRAQTCKRLNEVSAEHQTWLTQATLLQIPIPAGAVPSTVELKDWATSWLRSDKRWVRDDGDRPLSPHWFDMRQEGDNGTEIVMANFIPGGEFVVILYSDGQIDLKKVRIMSKDKWDLQDVAQYKPDNPEGSFMISWSQLLTETNLGRPLFAYVDERGEKYN